MVSLGQYDPVLTVPGLENWSNTISWSYVNEFVRAPRLVWRVDGEVAGYVQEYKNLHRVTVRDCGHMAPRKYACCTVANAKCACCSQPAWMLDLITRFVDHGQILP